MDHKDDKGNIYSPTLDALPPGEPFFVLTASHPYTASLIRRRLKRGKRDGILSKSEIEEMKQAIAICSGWTADG